MPEYDKYGILLKISITLSSFHCYSPYDELLYEEVFMEVYKYNEGLK